MLQKPQINAVQLALLSRGPTPVERKCERTKTKGEPSLWPGVWRHANSKDNSVGKVSLQREGGGGGNRGMQIHRSVLFFAKSVDPPTFLFKSETTTTSETKVLR